MSANDAVEQAREPEQWAMKAAEEHYLRENRNERLRAQTDNEIRELAAIIQKHAPAQGGNGELRKCLWLLLDGTKPDYSDRTVGNERQALINRAWKAYESAPPSLEREAIEALRELVAANEEFHAQFPDVNMESRAPIEAIALNVSRQLAAEDKARAVLEQQKGKK